MCGARSGNYTFHILLSFVHDEGISSVGLLACFWRHGILHNTNLYITVVSDRVKKKESSVQVVVHARWDQSGRILAPSLLP